jgi:YacP-like NYN domain
MTTTTSSSSFWRGILESLLVVSGFAGFGFAWAGLERRDAAGADYPPPSLEATSPTPSLWLVDGFNVLHAGVLRGRDRAEWWTEPRREQLVALAERFDDAEAEIWIVFDGSGPEDPAQAPASRVRRFFAPSADDWLVAQVRASPAPDCLAVVTADRAVAGRARHRGAQVVSPRAFLARCRS